MCLLRNSKEHTVQACLLTIKNTQPKLRCFCVFISIPELTIQSFSFSLTSANLFFRHFVEICHCLLPVACFVSNCGNNESYESFPDTKVINFTVLRSLAMKNCSVTGGLCFTNSLNNNCLYNRSVIGQRISK